MTDTYLIHETLDEATQTNIKYKYHYDNLFFEVSEQQGNVHAFKKYTFLTYTCYSHIYNIYE